MAHSSHHRRQRQERAVVRHLQRLDVLNHMMTHSKNKKEIAALKTSITKTKETLTNTAANMK